MILLLYEVFMVVGFSNLYTVENIGKLIHSNVGLWSKVSTVFVFEICRN